MRRFVKESKKKAFTLVELLVVIAILAILAGVSVVGYLGFTEKANKSVDEQLCTQYNTLLKAQTALDQDISLAEFIVLLEENGINSNQFNTMSKSYVFAYHPDAANGNNEVVLLDKESGTIAYPEGKVIPGEELWAAYPQGNRLQKGVYNYTLFSSEDYSTLTLNEPGKTYNFDLNNHALRFTKQPTNPVSAKNGSVIKGTDTAIENLTVDTETTKEIEKKDVVIVDKKDTPKATIKATLKISETDELGASTLKLTGKNFFTSGFEDKKYENLALGGFYTDVTRIELENCIFDNYSLSFADKPSLDVVIKNCTFYNTQSYILSSSNINSFTFENNKIINSNRGLNLGLAPNGINIKNNSFDIVHVETNKNEHKDNAIQFAFSGDNPSKYLNNWGSAAVEDDITVQDTVKVNITGNTVVKANALITIHVTAIQNHSKKQYEAINNKVLTADVFTFENNTLPSGTKKVVSDPGTQEDMYDKEKTKKYNSDEELKKSIAFYEGTMISQLAALVK